MITCDLIGRLGNQMFQIATTAATAWRNGTEFAFPTKAMGSYTGEVYFPNLPVTPNRAFPIYREKGHHYSPIPPIKDGKLHGYWQSEHYFKEYRKEIIDLFGIKPFMRYPYSCFVHIRLGDYVTFKDKHPPVTVEYLDAAMRRIYEETSGQIFFAIMSDDMDAAQKMIWHTRFHQEKKDEINFAYTPLLAPKSCIADMSAVDHCIIANSSFSWWGAWLNENPNKIVIAPKVWFGPGNKHLSDKDIVPENWIRL